MAENEDEEIQNLIASTKRLTQDMEDMLKRAKQFVLESVEEFVNKKIGCLLPLMSKYCETFQRNKVISRKSLDVLFKKYFRSDDVQEVFEEFSQVEDEWDNFLEDIDNQLRNTDTDKAVSIGSPGPNDIPLKVAGSIENEESEFVQHRLRIVVVSFGEEKGAIKWLEDTKCPFKLLLDPKREIYQSMGLTKSVSKTWGTKPLSYYAEQMAEGREIPKAYKDIKDDPHQMGGDLIIDTEGKVVLKYCSKSSPDRPSVDYILDTIQTHNIDSSESETTKSPDKKSESTN